MSDLKKTCGTYVILYIYIYIFIYNINKCEVYLDEGIITVGGAKYWTLFASMIANEFSNTISMT